MNYTAFWTEFSRRADQLGGLFRGGSHRQAFEEIDQLLESHGIHFCFDMGEHEGLCGLFFSPEGNASAAAEIDRLVRLAPSMTGWRIFGRRQRRDPQDLRSIVLHLYHVDVDHCRYHVQEVRPPVVTMFVPSESDLTKEEAQGLADTFISYALGEEMVMTQGIEAVVERGMPHDRPLLSTAQLIHWFKSQFNLASETWTF